MPHLRGALQGVTAAVVGVILSLSVWFCLHVFFAKVDAQSWEPLALWVPDLASIDWQAVALACIAMMPLLWSHLGLVWTVILADSLGLTWHLLI